MKFEEGRKYFPEILTGDLWDVITIYINEF
jgi:hypothetical protein